MITVVRDSRYLRHLVQLLPPLIIGALFILAATQFDHGRDRQPRPTAVPVVVVANTPAPAPNPIRIVQLEVQPEVLHVGSRGTLLNGICNDSSQTVNVQLYLGAQRVGVDPLLATSVDLVGRDTPEGRVRRNIEPGCFGTEPINDVVDARLTPGKWKLDLVVMVTGDGTPLTRSSGVFEVRPAE